MKSPNFVRCRPIAITTLAIVGVGVAAFIAMTVVTSPKHDTLTGLILFAVIGVPFLLALLWSLWAQVVADERSLRWRLGLMWKQASWEDVTDFYKQLGRKTDQLVIETRQGSLRLQEGFWNNLKALQDIVRRKAVNAKTSEWAIYGTRPATCRRSSDTTNRRFVNCCKVFGLRSHFLLRSLLTFPLNRCQP